jgi:hypothetical protein
VIEHPILFARFLILTLYSESLLSFMAFPSPYNILTCKFLFVHLSFYRAQLSSSHEQLSNIFGRYNPLPKRSLRSPLNAINENCKHSIIRNFTILFQWFWARGRGCSGTESTITEATTGILYQPRMIMDEDECRAIGGMLGRGNRNTRGKPAPAPLCPPQI